MSRGLFASLPSFFYLFPGIRSSFFKGQALKGLYYLKCLPVRDALALELCLQLARLLARLGEGSSERLTLAFGIIEESISSSPSSSSSSSS
jgi:hypothetical protein